MAHNCAVICGVGVDDGCFCWVAIVYAAKDFFLSYGRNTDHYDRFFSAFNKGRIRIKKKTSFLKLNEICFPEKFGLL